MQTNDFLEAIKRRYSIGSDYALAKFMGINPNNDGD